MAATKISDSYTMREAARMIPGQPHVATLRRWARKGVYGTSLKTFRLGRREFVHAAELERFLHACTAGYEKAKSQAASASHKSAEAELDQILDN